MLKYTRWCLFNMNLNFDIWNLDDVIVWKSSNWYPSKIQRYIHAYYIQNMAKEEKIHLFKFKKEGSCNLYCNSKVITENTKWADLLQILYILSTHWNCNLSWLFSFNSLVYTSYNGTGLGDVNSASNVPYWKKANKWTLFITFY